MVAKAAGPKEFSELTLLVDGDVIAFRAAAAAQEIHEDDFGFFTPWANRHVGEAIVDNLMIGLEQLFDNSHTKVALSDPHANWRMDLLPTYKGTRKELFAGQFRPLLLTALKEYLREKYQAFHWDTLEADDVLGILNTEPQDYPGKRILVGNDKDFKTVPGLYYRIGDLTPSKKPIVTEITPAQAERFHLLQTLMGDATDGYAGCPGVGKTRAEEVLSNPVLLTPQQGVKTRGVNKGEPTTKWVAEPTRDYWAMVLSHYRKGYQDDPDADPDFEALRTARIAHILQHEDYDRESGTITLWTPSRIIEL